MSVDEMDVERLGWHPGLDEHFAPFREQGLAPARVVREHKHLYTVNGEHGELMAEVSGKLMHRAMSRSDYPAVGDWVAVQPRADEGAGTIHAILPRQSSFSRGVAGGQTDEQVVAANVDTALLVSGLDGDFNLRRIERYLTLAWQSGASPVIVLNKADVCDEVDGRIDQVESIAPGATVLAVSALQGLGMDALRQHVRPGQTAVLLGSSGVGKSTLINSLLGTARQRVEAVREDDSHGRHTTTYRELILLPDGGMIIDTPGMRELQLWTDAEALDGAFQDIDALAAQCRFRDCGHNREPGCVVRAALLSGALDRRRFQSYLKLQKELRYLDRRQDQRANLIEKARWKKIIAAGRKRARRKW